MAQIRAELAEYEITTARKRMILTGIGAAVWKAMQKGALKAGRGLAVFVHDLILRLREARGIGNAVRFHPSATPPPRPIPLAPAPGWAVCNVLNERAARARELAATERLVEEIEHERDEARRGFIKFLEGAGVSSLREYVVSVSVGEG
ncbi:MAG: hypothetical protein J7J52_02815 [Deltaproteobacteria bacterium]|nr:hypothetical protein [Deltaproteobacteria bacterium]